MIPRKLELKNFLSYGEPTQVIDFSDYHLMCLSGKNGHGKSALLDALTWAIWGQARKTTGTSKADEGLLRLGQTRMMVSLEFEFNGRIYRVRREYAKTYGKPYAALDLEIFNTEKNKFLSLTDKTIRQTQAKIEQLIGLDFDTFVNSAFIRQGQSNEFSKKSPKERKQILATILGLSRFDVLQQKALEHSRQKTDEKKLISMMQDQHTTALAHQPTLLEKLTLAQQMLAKTIEEFETKNRSLLDLEKEIIRCEQSKTQHEKLISEFADLHKNYARKEDSFKHLVHVWKKNHAQILTSLPRESLEKQKQELHLQEKMLLQAHQKSLALQEQSLMLQESYNKRHQTLKAENDKKIYDTTLLIDRQNLDLTHHKNILNEKKARLSALEKTQENLKKELINLKEILKEQALFEVKLEADKLQFEKRRSFYALIVQKGNWVKNELTELEHRQKVVHDQTNPSCPLCEQVLTLKRKQFLSNRFSDQERFLLHRFNRLSKVIKNLKQILVEQHQYLEASASQQNQFSQKALRSKEIETQLLEIAKEQTSLEQEILSSTQKVTLAEQELVQVKNTHAENTTILGAKIDQDPELIQIQQSLTILTKERSSLSYDPVSFKNIQDHIHQLETLIKAHENSVDTKKILMEVSAKITALRFELKQLKLYKASFEEDIKTAQEQANRLPDLQKTMLYEKESCSQKSLQKDCLLKEIAELEHSLRQLEAVFQEHQSNVKKVQLLDEEIEDYTYLAQAFGKNGIQALLIEDAIPEIEKEANDILTRLSNNQAQIFIESLRDLKSGGVKETLDIQISDNAGIRPYEMFSGGEAFRIDFSLRIAISKLLARRAGTALQTLIIDEGFGSQDEDGLHAIMQALYAIQHDFSKIIIVSHLPEFKENFPVHLIIEKGPNGSIINIEERG